MPALLDEVLSRLPKLGAAELEEVRKRLLLLRTVDQAAGQVAAIDQPATMALEVIAGFLTDRGLEHASVPALRKATQYQSFTEKVRRVVSYMASVEGLTARRAFFRLGVELLYDDLCRMEVAVSARTLMSHIHRLPAVINKSFPGYAQAGHLGKIIGKR